MNKKFTLSHYKKKIPEILEIFNHTKSTLPIDQKDYRIKQIQEDFWYFFHTYLQHYAESKSPPFHKEIINMIETESSPIVIAAPRGFSKSTIVSFAYLMWCIIRNSYHFIIIISATDALAEDLSEFIRIEFEHNKAILQDFGKLLKKKGKKGDFLVNNTRILARGRQQALRGFRSQEHRPDLIILDDIEKDDEALSPKIIKKSLDTIIRGIIPSLKPGGKIIIIGTILRRRSVIGSILLNNEEPWNQWSKKIFRAINPDLNGKESSLWEERFSLSFLKKQKKIMGISAFNSEYQNMPTDDDIAIFKESYIVEGTIHTSSPKILFIDPSVDGIKNNDFKACVIVSKNTEGLYEIVDAILVQGSDTKFFNQIINIYQKHQSTILGCYIESNAFQLYYMKELDHFAKKQNIDLRLSGIKQYQKKEVRITRLLPLFETGRIFFNPELCTNSHGKKLIEQLLFFPNSSIHDDGPDALASAVDLFDKIDHYASANPYQVLPKKQKTWFRP